MSAHLEPLVLSWLVERLPNESGFAGRGCRLLPSRYSERSVTFPQPQLREQTDPMDTR